MTDLQWYQSLPDIEIGPRVRPGAIIDCDNAALDLLSIGLQPIYLRKKSVRTEPAFQEPPKDWLGVANYVAVILGLTLLILIARMVMR